MVGNEGEEGWSQSHYTVSEEQDSIRFHRCYPYKNHLSTLSTHKPASKTHSLTLGEKTFL